jgi:hypothetical protein
MEGVSMNIFDKYELKLKIRKMMKISTQAGETVTVRYIVPESFLMTGAEYFKSGGGEDDGITFEIKHPVTQAVLQLVGDDLYVGDKGSYQFYQASLPQGLAIDVTYKNRGTESASMRINLITHIPSI